MNAWQKVFERTPPELKEALHYLRAFFVNPLREIRSVPYLKWETVLSLHFVVAISFGALLRVLASWNADGLANLIGNLVLGIIIGIFVFVPLAFVTSLTLYYVFMFVCKVHLSYRKIHTLIIFCFIPFSVLHAAYDFFFPLSLLGLALSGLLLNEGLIHNFGLEKKLVKKVVIGALSAFTIILLFDQTKKLIDSNFSFKKSDAVPVYLGE
jgi:hypothetical protein